MILNENTGSHAFYQKASRQPKPRARTSRVPEGLATERCPGSLEAKLEWMRRRQQWKKSQRQRRV